MKKKAGRNVTLNLFIALILSFTINNFYGQNLTIDSCGIDTLSQLNKYETSYLNKVFSLEKFNFENKIVKFRYANYGTIPINKFDYFKFVKEWQKLNNTRIQEEIIILTSDEKVQYGEIDAIIICWSKFPITNKSRNKVLKNILKRK